MVDSEIKNMNNTELKWWAARVRKEKRYPSRFQRDDDSAGPLTTSNYHNAAAITREWKRRKKLGTVRNATSIKVPRGLYYGSLERFLGR